jgi:hypothetical protein
MSPVQFQLKKHKWRHKGLFVRMNMDTLQIFERYRWKTQKGSDPVMVLTKNWSDREFLNM